IRSADRGRALLTLGARRVIVGSALLKDGSINSALANDFGHALGRDCLTFAVDSRGGKVAIQGWKQTTNIDPLHMIRELETYCGAFLYTHIDSEGTMTGFPHPVAQRLRQATSKRLIVAGGIRSSQEVEALDAIGVDAVVGMAVYMGKIG